MNGFICLCQQEETNSAPRLGVLVRRKNKQNQTPNQQTKNQTQKQEIIHPRLDHFTDAWPATEDATHMFCKRLGGWHQGFQGCFNYWSSVAVWNWAAPWKGSRCAQQEKLGKTKMRRSHIRKKESNKVLGKWWHMFRGLEDKIVRTRALQER